MPTFRIANMECDGCARAIAATLRAASPGAEPSVDLPRREATGPGDPSLLLAALRADGWDAEPIPA